MTLIWDVKKEGKKGKGGGHGKENDESCHLSIYLFVCSSQTFADCGCGGPGKVPRPFIHPVWMRDAVWGHQVKHRQLSSLLHCISAVSCLAGTGYH
jgi:hypothetical protein